MTTSATATEPAYPLSTRVAIEGLGSFFIVFAGLGTALFSAGGAGTTVGFAYGLAMVAAIISFGHISNGYFNPAFSLGMAVAGRLKFSAMVLYVVAQTVGALLASVVWLALMQVMPAGATPETAKLFGALANGFDSHSPSQVPMVGVLIVEIVAVAVLTAMVLGVTSARNKTALGPIAIGLAFAVAVGITMPLSNGSLNPARATSVVFVADSWALGQLWLFWLAPLFGAALAAAIFRSFAPSRGPAVALPSGLPAATDDAGAATADDAGEHTGALAGTSANNGALSTAKSTSGSASGPASEEVSEAGGIDDAQEFFDSPKK
ncbi:aquaporin [Arthrobacter sp. H35-D1]|uniref:aquaporin n=1 Tax=Arthrobacter sp. H35-D1 TaxID=3046202 RepID=UPI0024B8F153|nr:aquaporin [Arthrobacter sp. H35-D1]MDJ0313121.1 aquaporin [Arthrobacter sp. H35-D1]